MLIHENSFRKNSDVVNKKELPIAKILGNIWSNGSTLNKTEVKVLFFLSVIGIQYKAIKATDMMNFWLDEFFDECSEYIESALAGGGKRCAFSSWVGQIFRVVG